MVAVPVSFADLKVCVCLDLVALKFDAHFLKEGLLLSCNVSMNSYALFCTR